MKAQDQQGSKAEHTKTSDSEFKSTRLFSKHKTPQERIMNSLDMPLYEYLLCVFMRIQVSCCKAERLSTKRWTRCNGGTPGPLGVLIPADKLPRQRHQVCCIRTIVIILGSEYAFITELCITQIFGEL